ncbi:MAG: MerC domain-containing protein [Proteobacteria bacterium]|nr:MAG: MerC domain-containing protein [Pseudomonadota bacterium]
MSAQNKKFRALSLVRPSTATLQTWSDRLGLCYHEMFHEILLGILPLLAVLAFIPGYRQHRKLAVFYWALPGIIALALGVLLTHETPVFATAVTVLGSVLLVRAHLLNRKECACCATGHDHQRATRLAKVTPQPLKPTMRLKEVTAPNASLDPKITTSPITTASSLSEGHN